MCADREAWWIKKTEEMEAANNPGNIRRLFQLIRSTGPRRPTVSETIKDHQGILISEKKERLDRWADHFEEQFNWPAAAVSPGAQSTTEPWTVKLDPPSSSEVREIISSLKRHRASGPDSLLPALFKDDGESLV